MQAAVGDTQPDLIWSITGNGRRPRVQSLDRWVGRVRHNRDQTFFIGVCRLFPWSILSKWCRWVISLNLNVKGRYYFLVEAEEYMAYRYICNHDFLWMVTREPERYHGPKHGHMKFQHRRVRRRARVIYVGNMRPWFFVDGDAKTIG